MLEMPVSTAVSRGNILAAVRAAVEPLPYVHALWEGGAAAFGRVDAWSDIDLQVDVDDDHVGEIFGIVERALESLSPIALRLEVPQPTWHGHHQTFYRLRDAGEFLLVDFVAILHSNPNKFLQRAIHGSPVVHFDKTGVTSPEPLDADAMIKMLRARVASLAISREMFRSFPDKELNRGNLIEAVAFFQGQILRPLVEVLRIIHAPARHNFHTRYIYYDLPADTVRELEPMFLIADADALRAACRQASRLFGETLAAIDWDRVRERLSAP